MKNQQIISSVFIVAACLLLANTAHAFDMGNMMNPSKWMGGGKDDDRDRYDDYYDEPGYGYPGGGYGYGGPPGYGYGGAPGYGYGGAPGYGYGGAPGYGYGGAPGYGAAPGYGGAAGYGAAPGYGGAPAYGAPGTESSDAEIMRLKERIRQLEGGLR
jgi:hypothetical protein